MNCQICDSYSGYYPLCKRCSILKKDGKVYKDEDTGEWKIKKSYEYLLDDNDDDFEEDDDDFEEDDDDFEEDEDVIYLEDDDSSYCITCGEEANNKLFCKKCYHKYKNKSLVLKITNCQEIEIMSDEYVSGITCADGHMVKSKSEKIIDDYLYNNKILHVYEKALYYENDKNPIKVDFYLPDKDIYIDHLGFDGNKKYDEKTAFNFEVYRKQKKTVICTTEKDMHDIESILDYRLQKGNYKEKEINQYN